MPKAIEPLVSLSKRLIGERRKRLQMEVGGPEVRAPSGLFAPIRPFETETMGGLFRQSCVRFPPSAGGNSSADGSERGKNFCRKCCEDCENGRRG